MVICEGENELKMNEIANEWKKKVEELNLTSEIQLSAAIGYAAGEGKNIGAVIKLADDRMYANKVEQKKQRQ